MMRHKENFAHLEQYLQRNSQPWPVECLPSLSHAASRSSCLSRKHTSHSCLGYICRPTLVLSAGIYGPGRSALDSAMQEVPFLPSGPFNFPVTLITHYSVHCSRLVWISTFLGCSSRCTGNEDTTVVTTTWQILIMIGKSCHCKRSSVSKARRGAQLYTNRCHVFDICQVLLASMQQPRPGQKLSTT